MSEVKVADMAVEIKATIIVEEINVIKEINNVVHKNNRKSGMRIRRQPSRSATSKNEN